MTLLNLIRNRDTRDVATAIPAIAATHSGCATSTIARIATVAVATPTEKNAKSATLNIPQLSTSMTAKEEMAIRAWLNLIGEYDPECIAAEIRKCQQDVIARNYFVARSVSEANFLSTFSTPPETHS